MASYEQVIKFENDAPKGVVRLVEAHGFYRAYSHSAFLFRFPQNRLLERIGERSHKKTELGYVRNVMIAKSRLPSFGSFSADGLRYFPSAID